MFLCLKQFSLFKHFLVQLYLRMFTADMIGHLCWFSHPHGLLESLTSGHCLVFQCHGNKAGHVSKSCDFCSSSCTFWSCTFNFIKKVLKQSKMNSDKPTPQTEVKWWYIVTATVTILCFCPRQPWQ